MNNCDPEPGIPDLTSEESIEALDALLRDHAERGVERALSKLGGPLSLETLDQFLTDSDCLRYPTTIAYTDDGMEPHQFAEPFFHGEGADRNCTLHIHPRFQAHQDLIPAFVAYMAGVINYGHIANAELCEKLGAGLLGMEPEAFYESICDAVDGVTE